LKINKLKADREGLKNFLRTSECPRCGEFEYEYGDQHCDGEYVCEEWTCETCDLDFTVIYKLDGARIDEPRRKDPTIEPGRVNVEEI